MMGDIALWMAGAEAENIKRCPMCAVPIERDAGCAQMMCKRCKHVFCWYCLASLDVRPRGFVTLCFKFFHCYFTRMIFYFGIMTRENVRENWDTLVFQSFFTELRSLSLSSQQQHKYVHRISNSKNYTDWPQSLFINYNFFTGDRNIRRVCCPVVGSLASSSNCRSLSYLLQMQV